MCNYQTEHTGCEGSLLKIWAAFISRLNDIICKLRQQSKSITKNRSCSYSLKRIPQILAKCLLVLQILHILLDSSCLRLQERVNGVQDMMKKEEVSFSIQDF